MVEMSYNKERALGPALAPVPISNTDNTAFVIVRHSNKQIRNASSSGHSFFNQLDATKQNRNTITGISLSGVNPELKPIEIR